MPCYSQLSSERDLFGELAWLPNFDVKDSKDNEKRYKTLREFFDSPIKNLNELNSDSIIDEKKFYRENAPPNSVAR